MPDPRFFKKSRSFSAGELAEALDCTIQNAENPDLVLEDVSPLAEAQAHHLSFFDNIKYRDDFAASRAGACFVAPEALVFAPEGMVCLVTPQPYKAYALAAQKFYPETLPEARISDSARIHESVRIGPGCVVEDGACIAADVELGDGVWIGANAVIGAGVRIGRHSRVGANASVSHAIIGEAVRLYPGVRIGQDGFGFAIDKSGHVKVPQLGRVMIGDHVEIGANSCIDRGAGPDTVIGSGTWIDNLVQIGHNVRIGRGCVIVAQVGISGSTEVGDFTMIGGQVGLAGHLRIGRGVRIAAQSGVMRDIPDGEEHMGSPSFPRRHYLRQIAALNRLIGKGKND